MQTHKILQNVILLKLQVNINSCCRSSQSEVAEVVALPLSTCDRDVVQQERHEEEHSEIPEIGKPEQQLG